MQLLGAKEQLEHGFTQGSHFKVVKLAYVVAGQLLASTHDPLLRKLVAQAVQVVAVVMQAAQGRVQFRQNSPEEYIPTGQVGTQRLL